jgi:hypothetical protein
MSRHQLVLTRMAPCIATGLILLAVLGGCASNTSDTYRTPIKVTISVGTDGIPVATPDEIRAREGDRVHWVFQGPEAKEFAVIFKSVADSPFDWSAQKGASLRGKVKPGAAKGGARTEYKYDVDVAGKVKDPKIIIES